jgi:hypothetical protein
MKDYRYPDGLPLINRCKLEFDIAANESYDQSKRGPLAD